MPAGNPGKGERMMKVKKPFMKTALLAVLALAVFALTASGCQPTPEKPAVIGKNDGKLEQKISAPAVPEKKYEAPDRWKETVSKKLNGINIKADIDSAVEIPDTSRFPVYSIAPVQIRFEQVDAAVQEAAKGQSLYSEGFASQVNTKKKIRGQIENYTSQLEQSQKEGMKGLVKEYQRILKKLYADLETAPENYAEAEEAVKKKVSDNVKKSREDGVPEGAVDRFANMDIGPVRITRENYSREAGFNLVVGEGYAPKRLEISAGQDQKRQYIRYGGGEDESGPKAGSDGKLTRDQAEKEAKRIADALNSGLTLTDACGTFSTEFTEDDKEIETPNGYRFIFTRVYDSVPARYAVNALGVHSAELYRKAWMDERLIIGVGYDGGISLDYQSPAEVKGKTSENVELLPFDRIQELFRKNIVLRPMVTDIDTTTRIYAKVDRVTLSMVKIPAKDQQDTYTVMPAWDFYGNWMRAYIENDEEHPKNGKEVESSMQNNYSDSLLTINAIDGSVIERESMR